jgi:hypothetical protein
MHAIRSAALAVLATGALVAQAPCWETNLGASLALGDDTYSSALTLGFPFTFGGTPYTSIVVCSNGYVWLGTAAPAGIAPDYTPTEAELSSQGPRIAPLWLDFNPTIAGSGNIWFNTFPPAGSVPGRAVITWSNVFEYGGTTPLSMQLTLTDTNNIIIHYDSNMAVVNGGNFAPSNHVMGTSNGTGTVHQVDFNALPIVSAGNPTLYQTVTRGSFPYVGRDFEFTSDGAGGFVVLARPLCASGAFQTYGTGCPRGMSAYELFETPGAFDLSNTSMQFIPNGSGGYIVAPGPGFDTSYANPITMTDDSILAAQPLGFTFQYGGAANTAVDLSSNGMIYMAGGAHNVINGYPDAPTLLNDPNPIIGFLWQDLDLGTAGQAYWDLTPGSAMYTIVGAPYWNQGGSNDAQLKLLSSGSFIMSWRNAASTAGGPCMVGVSEGNGAANPGPTDWSVSLPLTLGPPGAQPLSLATAADSRPGIGLTFTMQIGHIPAGTALGAMVLSFTRQNIDLSPLGMTGCHQYVGLDASVVLVFGGATQNFNLNIPNSAIYLGLLLRAEAAAFSSGLNPFGVIASNGGEMRIGL